MYQLARVMEVKMQILPLIFLILLSPTVFAGTLITDPGATGSLTTFDGGGTVVVDDKTAPELVSSVIGNIGKSIVLTFDKKVSQGIGYDDSDWNIDCTTAGEVAFTFSGGDGTNQHFYSLAEYIISTETCDIDFNGAANSEEDRSGHDLAEITSDSVTNNSLEKLPLLQSFSVNVDGITWPFTYSELVTANTPDELCDNYDLSMSTAGLVTLEYNYGSGTRTILCTGDVGVLSGETISANYMDYTDGTIVDSLGLSMANLVDRTSGFTNNSTNVPPTLSLVVIELDGITWPFTYSEPVEASTDEKLCSDYVVDMSTAGTVTLTYNSGAGTSVVICDGDPYVEPGETVTVGLDYDSGSGTITDLGGLNLETIDDESVTNNSSECIVMGATGTYALWWNGEYDGNPLTACLDSGTDTVNGQHSGTSIDSGSKIVGVHSIEAGATNDDYCFAVDAGNINTSEGTAYLKFISPSGDSGNSYFNLTDGGFGNYVIANSNAGGNAIRARHSGDGGGEIVIITSGTTYTEETISELGITWSVASNQVAVRVCNDGTCDSEPWTDDGDADPVTAWDNAIDWACIGSKTSVVGLSDTIFGDELIIINSYKADRP